MTDTPGGLSEVNEADAIEQVQSPDGGLDDSADVLETDGSAPAAGRMDAEDADVLEQAQTVKPARDEEYPTADRA